MTKPIARKMSRTPIQSSAIGENPVLRQSIAHDVDKCQDNDLRESNNGDRHPKRLEPNAPQLRPIRSARTERPDGRASVARATFEFSHPCQQSVNDPVSTGCSFRDDR